MSSARVTNVVAGTPAADAGVLAGDVLEAVNGVPLRDVIEYQHATEGAAVTLLLDRDGIELDVEVLKGHGEPLGIEVQSAVFDRIRTCDNHCEFCFIYQLPKGMRRSLYLKDDDYRLSFLYGNFTTLTRFTEADLERVVTEGLSPLYVSIHATDADKRSEMLRNRRGGVSLRWLRALLDHDIEVHGQIVVCPGINGGDVLEDTLIGLLDEFAELKDVAIVPLGLSKFSSEERMRVHTAEEAQEVVELAERFADIFLEVTGRRTIFASDEFYLVAEKPFPPAEHYGGFPLHEDGIGMATAFRESFSDRAAAALGPQAGFFASVDGAPGEGYRSPRYEPGIAEAANENDRRDDATPLMANPVQIRRKPASRDAPVGILTGPYGAQVITPLIDAYQRDDVRVLAVENRYFGGNVAVSGLMVGEDIARVLANEPAGHRYLLPDVCLSNGRFLDDTSPDELPHPIEVVETTGAALREALQPPTQRTRPEAT